MNAVVLSVVLLVVASLVTYWAPQRFYIPVSLLLTVAFVEVGLLGGVSLEDMGLAPHTWVPGLAWGGACIAGMGIIYGLGLSVPKLEPLFSDKRAQEATGGQIAAKALLDVPFGTVLLEEMAFRGVVFGLFYEEWGTGWAVLWSSVLFGLWHVLPSLSMHESHDMLPNSARGKVLAIVGTVIATSVAGVLFALLRVVSGSVIAPACLHWSINSFGSLAAWFVGRRVARRARLARRRQAALHLNAADLDPAVDPELDAELGPQADDGGWIAPN
jgi:membrane protease YdiL (CAAX protease family)